MKLIAIVLIAACLSAQAARADYFFECQSSKNDGAENFNPDILSNGHLNAVIGSDDYEVSETGHYRVDQNYDPRTRTDYVRYLPTERNGGTYSQFPVILVHKSLLNGGARPDAKGNVGTIYAQFTGRYGFKEFLYRCQKSDRRNVPLR